jgi:hypothetical protein
MRFTEETMSCPCGDVVCNKHMGLTVGTRLSVYQWYGVAIRL